MDDLGESLLRILYDGLRPALEDIAGVRFRRTSENPSPPRAIVGNYDDFTRYAWCRAQVTNLFLGIPEGSGIEGLTTDAAVQAEAAQAERTARVEYDPFNEVILLGPYKLSPHDDDRVSLDDLSQGLVAALQHQEIGDEFASFEAYSYFAPVEERGQHLAVDLALQGQQLYLTYLVLDEIDRRASSEDGISSRLAQDFQSALLFAEAPDEVYVELQNLYNAAAVGVNLTPRLTQRHFRTASQNYDVIVNGLQELLDHPYVVDDPDEDSVNPITTFFGYLRQTPLCAQLGYLFNQRLVQAGVQHRTVMRYMPDALAEISVDHYLELQQPAIVRVDTSDLDLGPYGYLPIAVNE